MWRDIIHYTLNFFENINTWVEFLFTDYRLNITHPDNDFFNWLVGWFIDWVNNWNLTFKPIEIFTLNVFLVFFAIFLIKMIF